MLLNQMPTQACNRFSGWCPKTADAIVVCGMKQYPILILMLVATAGYAGVGAETQISNAVTLAGISLRSCKYSDEGEYVLAMKVVDTRDLSVLSTALLRFVNLNWLDGVAAGSVKYTSPLGDACPRTVALDLTKTEASDLSPLKGIPVTTLWLDGSRCEDLSTLVGLPLQRIWIGEHLWTSNGIAPLLEIETLKEIEGIPRDLFAKYCVAGFDEAEELHPLLVWRTESFSVAAKCHAARELLQPPCPRRDASQILGPGGRYSVSRDFGTSHMPQEQWLSYSFPDGEIILVLDKPGISEATKITQIETRSQRERRLKIDNK